jgi:hypothetical protein
VIAGGWVIVIIVDAKHALASDAKIVYVPGHCEVIDEVVAILLEPKAAQVKVIAPTPPTAETEAAPVHNPLQITLVTVGANVIAAG